MRACIKCGGNAYRDADTLCAHDFGEPPEPTHVWMIQLGVAMMERDWTGATRATPSGEIGWYAVGRVEGDADLYAEHPTRDGAIALWKERWRWGHALVALFRWLHAPREVSFQSITCGCGSARFVVDPVSIGRAARDARCVACGTRTCVVFKPRMIGFTTLELARELADLGVDRSAERGQLITQEMISAGFITKAEAQRDRGLVTIQAAPGAMTRAERGREIGEAIGRARRHFGAPLLTREVPPGEAGDSEGLHSGDLVYRADAPSVRGTIVASWWPPRADGTDCMVLWEFGARTDERRADLRAAEVDE